ncbi:hypothetical protein KSC_031850 [Ktedonobacter sp. SOSP1-52]|nr:hypothetical protein KSC_031850 [Ktedonobacter sp. SOSP1-52]
MLLRKEAICSFAIDTEKCMEREKVIKEVANTHWFPHADMAAPGVFPLLQVLPLSV